MILSKLNRENILSYALGFVVLWFGINEVMNPAAWSVFVPEFLGTGEWINTLVLLHGILLIISGLGLIFNFYRRLFAGIVAILLLGVIFSLISVSGLDEIAVRDIGLLGIAIALALKN